jgi:hypothetical protein
MSSHLISPLALTRERQSPACLLRMHYHHHHHSTICSHDVTTSLHSPLMPPPLLRHASTSPAAALRLATARPRCGAAGEIAAPVGKMECGYRVFAKSSSAASPRDSTSWLGGRNLFRRRGLWRRTFFFFYVFGSGIWIWVEGSNKVGL